MEETRKFRTVGRVETSALSDIADGTERECFVSFPSVGDEAMLATVSTDALKVAGIPAKEGAYLTALVNLGAQTPEEVVPEDFKPAEVPTG